MVARSFVNPTPSQQTALPYCSEHSSRPCPGPCRKRREAEYMTEVRGNGACPIHACILHTQVCAPPYTQTKFGFQTRSGDGGWWYETPTLCSHSATLPALTFLLPPHGFPLLPHLLAHLFSLIPRLDTRFYNLLTRSSCSGFVALRPQIH